MAEGVVKFFLEKLSDLVSEEVDLLVGVDEQVKLLQNKLDWMLLFLRVADLKRRQDESVKLWVKQIRDVTYHAEDVIDDFMVKICQHRRRTSHVFMSSSLTRCITCTHKLTILHDLASQIKGINATIEEISVNKSKYGIENIEAREMYMLSSFSNEVGLTRREEKRAPIIEESNMVGNEDSIAEVKSLLIGGEPRRTVVSIVGMGGLGKTTLAKRVYESSIVKRSFGCFAWVYVSQQYKMKELLQSIIKCVTMPYSDQETEEELKNKLRESLKRIKYLIILDDIWNIEAWDGLNTVFPDEKNGSRVLLTTRNKDVALHADPSRNMHELRFLNEVESWKLFLKKIFPLGGMNHEVSCPPELEDLGKKMLARCGGLPIAIVVLGGLLSRKGKMQIAWSKVNESVNWLLNTCTAGSYSCLGILASSYHDLPYYLKSCFLYMGLFPEGYEIRSSKLIQYWIAEGFIQRRGEATLEDIAEDYLEELIHRSMIQVARRKFDGRVKTIRIHDLLRDLIINEAKEDQFFQPYGSIKFIRSSSVRRIPIYVDDISNVQSNNLCNQHLRSLMCFSEVFVKQHWRCICRGVKFLRVLELQRTKGMSALPQEIGDLIHLKYLGLRETSLKWLPSSLSKLVNLQTLDIKYTSIECIPNTTWSLNQLRHLYTNEAPGSMTIWEKCFKRQPLGVDNLKDLCTLEVSIGDWINDGGLGRLQLLKKLVISGSLFLYKKMVSDSIAKLHCLRSLELRDSKEIPIMQFSNHTCLNKLYFDGRIEKLPINQELSFPSNLHKLTLVCSRIERDPMVVLEKLPNLSFLHLGYNSFLGKKMACSQGKFLQLQVLKFNGLKGLEEWIVEDGALAILAHLEIVLCGRMEMLPDGLQQLTKLQELVVHFMPKKFISRLAENVGEDWNKIKHIPSVNLQ